MARIRDIVFDSSKPSALARFWAEALEGYAIRPYDDAEVARLAELGRTPETDPMVAVDGPGPSLMIQQVAQVADATATRNRLHLDLIGGARSTEVERLVALGASVRDTRDDLTVMRDPEGNGFCVLDPEFYE